MEYDIWEYLAFIDCARCSYMEWIEVGMALKAGGYSCEVWDKWSRSDATRYTGDCFKRWETFDAEKSGGVTVRTIYKMAVDGGFKPGFGTMRGDTPKKIKSGEPHAASGLIAAGKKSPCEQLAEYLETMFEPGDIVAYVTDDVAVSGGRWTPRKGCFTRTAGELVKSLRENPSDIRATVGNYNEDCGAWIRVNSFDGQGVKDSNVTSFRYALIECDSVPVREQDRLYREMKLPVACMVYSGGKSLHAVVRVDASDADEYRGRVEYLYNRVEKEGLLVDRADRNPSRLSRMPGVMRGGVQQSLVATNLGFKSWGEWMYYSETGKAPPIIEFPLNCRERPRLAPELIGGVLRFGHKMLLSGPSKASKSFFLIELGICMSRGMPFLGFSTKKVKVFYLNLEIDAASCDDRIYSIGRAFGISGDLGNNFAVRHMRGEAKPFDEFAADIIREYKNFNFRVIIIDPVYKIMSGDENSAGDMGRLANQFDRICNSLHCAIIFAHHHSKGPQGDKSSLDRASGSGVFARDPDTIVDLMEIDVGNEVLERNSLSEDVTVWEMDITTRDFPRLKPRRIYFDYPVHRLDADGVFSECAVKGSSRGRKKSAVSKPRSASSAAGEIRNRKTMGEEKLAKAFDALETNEASATRLAQVLAGDDESTGFENRVRSMRHWIYMVCGRSERFKNEDRVIKRLY